MDEKEILAVARGIVADYEVLEKIAQEREIKAMSMSAQRRLPSPDIAQAVLEQVKQITGVQIELVPVCPSENMYEFRRSL